MNFSVALQTVITPAGYADSYLIIMSKVIRMIIRISRFEELTKASLFQGMKTPPYVVVLHRSKPTTYGGQKWNSAL